MNTMNLPGFTAETSLCRIISNYCTKSVDSSMPAPGAVVPQLPNCGPCTSLKWPNGTPTGSCGQDCTDALGNHYFQTCACGGNGGSGGWGGWGGGVFSGGWGRVIVW